MDEQEHNDFLETYFKKTLNGGNQHSQEDWNSPPDDMWTNIHQEIEEKDSRKVGAYWPLGVGILLLILSLGFFQNYQQGEKLAELTGRVAVYEEALSNLEEKLAISTSERNVSQADLPISTHAKNESHAVVDKQVAATYISTNQENILASVVERGKGEEMLKEHAQIPFQELKALKLTLPAPLPLSYPIPGIGIKQRPTVPVKKAVKGKRNFVRLVAGPFLASSDLIIPNPNKNSLAFSYSTGIQIGRKLNKNFSVELGATLTKLTTKSQTEKNLHIKQDEEVLNSQGLYESSFDFALPGLAEEQNSELILTRSEEEVIPEETPIPVSIQTKNTKTYLEIPLIFQYSVEIDRFEIGLRAGIQHTFLQQNKSQVNWVALNNADYGGLYIKPKRNNRGPGPGPRPKVVKHQTAVLAGLGASYQISEHLGIVIQPLWEHDLKKTNVNRDKEFYSQSFRLNSGLVLKF